ncbi:UNVERIFIED_CONTAM: hypothetical protein Sangu_1080600, partial [Sesamum angustifolium]
MEMKSFKVDEEAHAQLDMWKYVLGFTPMALVKCAIELQIADVVRGQESSICYMQTPLSRLLMKSGGNSIAALVLLESSHAMLAPWHRLSKSALISGASAFEAA